MVLKFLGKIEIVTKSKVRRHIIEVLIENVEYLSLIYYNTEKILSSEYKRTVIHLT